MRSEPVSGKSALQIKDSIILFLFFLLFTFYLLLNFIHLSSIYPKWNNLKQNKVEKAEFILHLFFFKLFCSFENKNKNESKVNLKKQTKNKKAKQKETHLLVNIVLLFLFKCIFPKLGIKQIKWTQALVEISEEENGNKL